MKRVHYNVSRLQNASSKTQVTNALEKLSGVQMINVDLGRGCIEVGYNEATDESQIKQSIENTGLRIE